MEIETLINKEEQELEKVFKKIDETCMINSKKVLEAFKNNKSNTK